MLDKNAIFAIADSQALFCRFDMNIGDERLRCMIEQIVDRLNNCIFGRQNYRAFATGILHFIKSVVYFTLASDCDHDPIVVKLTYHIDLTLV